MLSDMDIMRVFGVPNTTTRDWKKKDDEDWRKKVYLFLQHQDKSTVEQFFKTIDGLGIMKQEKEE